MQGFIAGCAAGFAQVWLWSPVEMIKAGYSFPVLFIFEVYGESYYEFEGERRLNDDIAYAFLSQMSGVSCKSKGERRRKFLGYIFNERLAAAQQPTQGCSTFSTEHRHKGWAPKQHQDSAEKLFRIRIKINQREHCQVTESFLSQTSREKWDKCHCQRPSFHKCRVSSISVGAKGDELREGGASAKAHGGLKVGGKRRRKKVELQHLRALGMSGIATSQYSGCSEHCHPGPDTWYVWAVTIWPLRFCHVICVRMRQKWKELSLPVFDCGKLFGRSVTKWGLQAPTHRFSVVPFKIPNFSLFCL